MDNYIYWDLIIHEESEGLPLSDIEGVSTFIYPLSDISIRCPFAIYTVDFKLFPALKKQYPYIEEVPEEVERLLRSGTLYPPALILARHEIYKLNLSETITKEEFSELLTKVLRKYLRRQWKDRFVLAEVQIPRKYETYVGSFVWILGYIPKIKVVHYGGSDDFGNYEHVSCFKLTEQQIKQLPIIEKKEYTLVDHKNKRMVTFDLTDEKLDFNEISEMIRTIR
ncbi:MAG: hypothetical protein JXB49_28375 [Bacteroidales bacterium]|nr:hypothetical protein [Bacteroidales bacterium]